MVLVLCMIPATVITAFARGKGVYNSGRENQSINLADGQQIPETIKVDGYLNDTGWPFELWNHVDSSTGHWNNVTLADKHAEASYKYQIRADYEQLYIGASIVMPTGVSSARFSLWFKEEGHTDNNGGVANGYTDLIVIEIDASGNGDPVVTAVVHDPYNQGDTNSTTENALPAQISKTVAKKSVENERTVVNLEFNNLLEHIFNGDIANVSYYVSLDLSIGDGKYDSLYHPKYYHSDNANLPTFEYWPTDADGKAGGKYIDTDLKSANAPLSEITVDGKFDEAIWGDLVDENGNYESLSGDTIYGTGVKYYDNAFVKTNDTSYDSSYNSKDAETNRNFIRFKYELRVDGEYLYGAVVAYVPPIKSYTVDNGDTVNTSPDLCINFFDDKRCDYPEGYTPGGLDASEGATSSEFTGYQPEATLQIRSLYSQYIEGDANYGKIFYTFGNTWPKNKQASGVAGGLGWGNGLVNVSDKNELDATRVEREGNLWNFEFKVLLSAVPVDENGNITYSVAVYDRYNKNNDTHNRFVAYTGKNTVEYSTAIPQNNYELNKNNVITKAQIDAAKNLEIAKNYSFSDGVLDQNLWTALTAADDKVDGRERNKTLSPAQGFAHKLTADTEYLYGAMILKSDSWTTDDVVRVWVNRKKTDAELEAAISSELKITSVSGKRYSDDSYATLLGLLTNGVHDTTATYGYSSSEMYARFKTGEDFVLGLSELFAVKDLVLYMGGGTASRKGAAGIYIADSVKVYYSADGVNWSDANATMTTELVKEDGTADSEGGYMDSYKFKLSLPKHVEARYIKLDIKPKKGTTFLWFSEIDVYGTEAHGMYYALTMWPEEEGERTISCNNVYLTGHNPNSKPYSNDGSFDFKSVVIDGNTRAVEFRASLETLGIKEDLTAGPDEELFYYYVSLDRNNYGGLYYPRNNTGYNPHRDDENWFMDEVYDGALKFSRGDKLDSLTIDGKLDEYLWIGDEAEMIHVDATNGMWASQPKYGNSLEYDYVIYAGTNYLYGAAIIDESAISSEKAYDYINVPHTRFEIWIDNCIDETEWMTDGNDKTNIVADSEYNQKLGADGKPQNGWNNERQWEVTYFVNYYYNMYLVSETTPVTAASGTKFVCGGSSPKDYHDPTKSNTDDDLTIVINESNWNWGMSTVNGKTYVEFMIDLDNFYCDRSKGINYYVSATHAYGTETDTTSDDETLSLFHPQNESKVENSSPIWITHINNKFPEGAGVLFTAEYIKANDTNNNNYWLDGSKAWWSFILLTPVDAANNVYKVKEIRPGYTDNNDGIPFRASQVQAGELVYAFNKGNDWTYWIDHPDEAAKSGVDISGKTAEDSINYINTEAVSYHDWARALVVGDELKFDFDPIITNQLSTSKTERTDNTGPLATQTVWNYQNDTPGETKEVKWYEPGYVCNSTATIVKKADSRVSTEVNEYYLKAPSTGTWYAQAAGKIEALTHFSPDSIEIDGVLNEPAWDNDNWISIIENANGTLAESDSAETYSQNWLYKYQLRTDGEYLYVGVKYNGVKHDVHKPEFTLWLKTDDESDTWTHFYSVGYAENGGTATLESGDLAIDYALPDGASLVIDGPVGSVNATDTTLGYKNMLSFAQNTSKTAVGAKESNSLYKGKYGDSALFGYTEEIQENVTSGQYNPDIRTTRLTLGNESAIMQDSASNNGHLVVEFKVALSEFGGEDGFEYFVESKVLDYDLVYPICFTEANSEGLAYQENLPMWKWSKKMSEKVTKADIESGEMRMRLNSMPVVTLGAKINANYKAADGNEYKAIRMGALYNEDYIRNWRKSDATTLDPSDEMYTAPINDYWDVADLGIVMLPTQLLGVDQELTLETDYVVSLSADNIIKWVNDADTGGWSNFADYENFVFYATLYGVPENIKVSFRGYVDFYASTGTETYYDHTIIRSYDMIKSVVGDWMPEN